MENSILTVIVSSITGVITFFVGQTKAKKEIDNMALVNLEKSLDIYNRIIEGLKEEIIELNSKVKELEEKISNLIEENHSLKEMLKNKK